MCNVYITFTFSLSFYYTLKLEFLSLPHLLFPLNIFIDHIKSNQITFRL